MAGAQLRREQTLRSLQPTPLCQILPNHSHLPSPLYSRCCVRTPRTPPCCPPHGRSTAAGRGSSCTNALAVTRRAWVGYPGEIRNRNFKREKSIPVSRHNVSQRQQPVLLGTEVSRRRPHCRSAGRSDTHHHFRSDFGRSDPSHFGFSFLRAPEDLTKAPLYHSLPRLQPRARSSRLSQAPAARRALPSAPRQQVPTRAPSATRLTASEAPSCLPLRAPSIVIPLSQTEEILLSFHSRFQSLPRFYVPAF